MTSTTFPDSHPMPYPLLSIAFWTDSVASLAECRMTGINNYRAVSAIQLFGGHKRSRIGLENRAHGLHEFTNLQVVRVTRG